jgi:malate dehydrogenase (oxaloacetate-decarboxylating)(NADP+)
VTLKEDALSYHASGRPGKIKVVPTKPTDTADDLSLAYTPGVAEPCLAIAEDPDAAYRYTAKGNLVAVISNGTAVLGLGNLGALAGKPVMEGKGVLFKRFADIDVFDIEIDSTDPEEVIRVCELIAPTFGGINLEDIRAPECFMIEERLKQSLDIPVFHDDQHGTAIISAAALLNACTINEHDIEDLKIVVSGAGAASISVCKLYKRLGARAENILMIDSRGVIYKGREAGMNAYKEEFAAETDARTLADAMVDAQVFVGLSQGGLVSKEMVESMGERPIIFAMANPTPEITPDDVKAVRNDAIMATGRSDYPNQVNNVLGFPFIFRGALDVRATAINEEMKLAAVYALAELAQRGEAVPAVVKRAYPGEDFDFGPSYIIPKPFDSRVLQYVAPAVAQAAMESGVARKPVDLREYEQRLLRTAGEIAKL